MRHSPSSSGKSTPRDKRRKQSYSDHSDVEDRGVDKGEKNIKSPSVTKEEGVKEEVDKYSNEDVNSRKNSFNDYMREKNDDHEDGKDIKKSISNDY